MCAALLAGIVLLLVVRPARSDPPAGTPRVAFDHLSVGPTYLADHGEWHNRCVIVPHGYQIIQVGFGVDYADVPPEDLPVYVWAQIDGRSTQGGFEREINIVDTPGWMHVKSEFVSDFRFDYAWRVDVSLGDGLEPGEGRQYEDAFYMLIDEGRGDFDPYLCGLNPSLWPAP